MTAKSQILYCLNRRSKLNEDATSLAAFSERFFQVTGIYRTMVAICNSQEIITDELPGGNLAQVLGGR